MPYTPQYEAGTRTEPPVSVPSALKEKVSQPIIYVFGRHYTRTPDKVLH